MSGNHKEEFWCEVLKYLQFVSSNASTHGGNWLEKIQCHWKKTFFFVLIFSLQMGMFYVVIASLSSLFFANQQTLQTSMSWETPATLRIPYVTICNPMMFDLKKAKGRKHLLRKSTHNTFNVSELNINEKLLSYMYLTYNYGYIHALLNDTNFIKSMNTTYNNINVNRTNLALDLAIK